MDERALLDQALAGDVAATRRLVAAIMPIVQARVARTLVRRRGGSGRDARQEVQDLAQDVFAALFADDGKVLRAWDPVRGLTLASFCGLVAEREAASILRSGRRSPWTEAATETNTFDQRARWEGGYLQSAAKWAPRMLAHSVRRGDGRGLWAAVSLLIPPLALLILLMSGR